MPNQATAAMTSTPTDVDHEASAKGSRPKNTSTGAADVAARMRPTERAPAWASGWVRSPWSKRRSVPTPHQAVSSSCHSARGISRGIAQIVTSQMNRRTSTRPQMAKG